MNALIEWHPLDLANVTMSPGVKEKKADYAKIVSNLLDSTFQHPYALIESTTLSSITNEELDALGKFLTGNITKITNDYERPVCPIQSTAQQNKARHEYKKAMVDYISSFGYTFDMAPGAIRPAILEAVANYCEIHVILEET